MKDAYSRGTPILGICIGCQIILTHSEEGDTSGLNLIPGVCTRFNLKDGSLKIPHMGWNEVKVTMPHHLLNHLQAGDELYFVHSFYPQPQDKVNVYAACEYEIAFPAAIGRKNLFAAQFHPEKSQSAGLALLDRFARL